jgi:Xaa-Pro aminopeptidase
MRQRIRALQEKMGDIDCFLVTAPEDVFYYSGYMSMKEEGAILVVLNKAARLFTTQNGFQAKKAAVRITIMKKSSDFYDFVKNYRVAGFDEDSLLSGAFLRLKKHGLVLKPMSQAIKEPRMVKSPAEIDSIRKAINLTKKAFGLEFAGLSERAAAAEIDHFFRRSGAESAFDLIVASGPNSGSVHHTPSERKVRPRDLTIVDIGAKLDGYCADLTRTQCHSPGAKQKALMENVKSMQGQLIDSIRPGVKFSEVQAKYEEFMKKAGYPCFHSFGHGVGLAVHERPSKDDLLKENMVMTVEPGIYTKNLGGCRIEDIVVVKKGKVKILS